MTSLLLVVVLIVMGLGLLYAYRAQTPAVQTISLEQAIAKVDAGEVVKVTFVGTKAMLDVRTGPKQQTIVPEGPEAFEKVLNDYNVANPFRSIAVEHQVDTSGFQVIASILLSLLPVLLLGAFFLYLTSRLRSR